jgi:5-methylcytosine-specific restriction endonuclease McrA
MKTRSNNHISNQKLRLLRKQRGRCIACKGIFTPIDILQVDHIILRSKGGGSNLLNLQLLHQECHEKKTAKERTKEIDSQAELVEQLCKGKPLSTVSEEKPRG